MERTIASADGPFEEVERIKIALLCRSLDVVKITSPIKRRRPFQARSDADGSDSFSSRA